MVTTEWVVLVARAILWKDATYRNFKTDAKNTTVVLMVTKDRNQPSMLVGDAIRVWPLTFALYTFMLNATGAHYEFWQGPPSSPNRRIRIYLSCISRTSTFDA